ncbi:MAG TPA: RNA pseudouridine synthase [Eubacterium sp.]|nr:RluA family pseudouridine synthase [Lachnospiraceae bacterium]HAZ90698.1 RNA pseudouridine synthase [Eubacterium sp.]HBZ53302.1 RNA pseudouridine synthase [Eubacterium sp.]
MDNTFEFEIGMEDVDKRIDSYIASQLEDMFSRSYIQKLIETHDILVNGKPVKPSYKLDVEDDIYMHVPKPVELDVKPENIDLDILYEDDDIIVINKAKGQVVHPGAGHYEHTIVNGLLYHCSNLSGINGILRPGIVHRIDMNTTGVIVACKNDMAHRHIAAQLKEHSITRVYEAITYNSFSDLEGTVDAPLARDPKNRKRMAIVMGGKRAVTHYKLIENLGKYAHISCQLETGRTHQIRVHMASINHPLLGDDVYCNATSPFKLDGQTLHAKVLGFIHPSTGKYVEFSAPLPEYFDKLLSILRTNN